MIDHLNDEINVFLGQFIEAHRLREECPEETVRILIRSPFPGVVGVGEVHFHGERLLRLLMESELRPVVIRAGLPQLLGAASLELRRAHGMHRLRRPIFHLPRDEESRLPLGEGCDSFPPALAHDGVALPVPEPSPPFDILRSRIDHAFVRNDDLRIFLLPSALFPK